MRPDPEDYNRYILDGGRGFYAHARVLGLRDGEELFNGYDGVVMEGEAEPRQEWEEPRFTPAERQEVADYMIEVWRRWASDERRRPPDSPSEDAQQ